MMFEHDHGLAADGLAGAKVWSALIADAIAGKHRNSGYSYVYVHRNLPQSLNLWHNGQTMLTSPGNTGVPAAPTQLGTFPVFEHIPIGTMRGRTPTAPTTTTPASATSATSTTVTPSTRSPAPPSEHRKASAASSSHSPPPQKSGPTRRSARSSPSRTKSSRTLRELCSIEEALQYRKAPSPRFDAKASNNLTKRRGSE